MALPRSTIEQWAVLRAVIEEGGFAQAAEALHRSQSSISYAVGRLRDALGVDLLEQRGRRAILTEAGAALLAEVTPLIEELNRVEQRGRGIARGSAVRIRLVVDSLFPKSRLFGALGHIATHHPHAQVHLVESVRQTIDDLPAGSFDLAILVIEPGSHQADRVADVELVAVASIAHPLHAEGTAPMQVALAKYPIVEIRGYGAPDETPMGQGRSWRMNTVESAIDAVRHGLCYGWLPMHLIKAELENGRLRPLALKNGSIRYVPLGLYQSETRPAHDAAMIELARLLAAQPSDQE